MAWKHGGIEQELADGKRATESLGGKMDNVFPIGTTGLTDDRLLVVVDKVSPTPQAYPRRPGLAAKQPL